MSGMTQSRKVLTLKPSVELLNGGKLGGKITSINLFSTKYPHTRQAESREEDQTFSEPFGRRNVFNNSVSI